MNHQAEQQLDELRKRLQEIRTAKKWLQEFRVNASPNLSAALASYYNFLVVQESKTIEMGKRIKVEKN
jgi:hypothetical protein